MSNDNTHILHKKYVLLPSSRMFRTKTSKTSKKRDSFIPMSVRLLNDKHLWRLREHVSHYVYGFFMKGLPQLQLSL